MLTVQPYDGDTTVITAVCEFEGVCVPEHQQRGEENLEGPALSLFTIFHILLR